MPKKPKTYWNYRVVKEKDETGNAFLSICEVYYTNDVPHSWSEPVNPTGETKKELEDDLLLMYKAMDKPVLTVKGGKIRK
jgi:hypothetical protein